MAGRHSFLLICLLQPQAYFVLRNTFIDVEMFFINMEKLVELLGAECDCRKPILLDDKATAERHILEKPT